MMIGGLLHSYQDLIPKPVKHAELIRLEPPDFRPQRIGFSLPEVSVGNVPTNLHPFDLIRVFHRILTYN
jgi:hypothetical protein